jgi:hypothetical protein
LQSDNFRIAESILQELQLRETHFALEVAQSSGDMGDIEAALAKARSFGLLQEQEQAQQMLRNSRQMGSGVSVGMVGEDEAGVPGEMLRRTSQMQSQALGEGILVVDEARVPGQVPVSGGKPHGQQGFVWICVDLY